METKSMPSIRLGQQDDSSGNMMEKSVNLYRGTVVYDQALFSLSGRGDDDGLEVKLSAHYEGGGRRYALQRNQDAPTGILGLGWSMQANYIKLDKKTSYPLENRQYVLSFQGTLSRLVKQEDELLFTIPLSDCTEFTKGPQVPESVRKHFFSHGVFLSGEAVFLAGEKGRIQDNEAEQEFLLQRREGRIFVYTGGESYQCEDYKFWRVIYYPLYERWSIVRENGMEVSFGGNISLTEKKFRTSEGNSVSWSVAWSDGEGQPCWTGESAESRGQVQYASAWFISRAYSRFREHISFTYNEFGRNKQGLLNSVEQLVSPDGKPYTKACYLTGITDVFGRKVRLSYQDKLWSNETLLSDREYGDPHKLFPDTKPNGCQDCYETKYLDRIEILAPDDGSMLYRFQFNYKVDAEKGDFCKRFWIGYTIEMADGERLTGNRFEYCTDTSAEAFYGSLTRVIRPEGGAVSYHYQKAVLDSCHRTLQLRLPRTVLSGAAKPGVWFGPDYGVVLWSDSHKERLSLQIASWDGTWRLWQPHADSPLLCEVPGGVDDRTIKVLAQRDFAAVFYQTADTMRMHLFRKEHSRPACWKEELSGAAGCKWYREWSLSSGAVQCEAGDRFLLVQQYDQEKGRGSRFIDTWNWQQGIWQKYQTNIKAPSTILANKNEYLCVDVRGKVTHGILNADLRWVIHETGTLAIWEDDISQIAIALGEGVAAVVHNRSGSEKGILYDLFLLQWDQNGKLFDTTVYKDQRSWNHSDSWRPNVRGGSMAAVAGNLFLFNGRTWIRQSLTFPQNPDEGDIRYAYAKDYAVAVRATPGNPQALFTSYHPQEGCFQKPVLLELSLPQTHRDTSFEPVAGKDCLTIGSWLYIRPAGGCWEDIMNMAGKIDLNELVRKSFGADFQVNTATLCIEGTDYLICSLYGPERGKAAPSSYVAAFLLRDGMIYGQPQMLQGEKIFTFQREYAGRGGCFPFGNQMFVSYPQSFNTLDDTDVLLLHQYVADGITGIVQDWPLSRMEIDYGNGIKSETTYEQDVSTACFSKGAHFVKYCKTIYYPGGSKEEQPAGSVEKQFLSTASADTVPEVEYYHSMDGLLWRTVSRDETGKAVMSTANHWKSYIRRSLGKEDPNGGSRRLYGSYVLLQARTSTKDGITQKESYVYTSRGASYTYHGQVMHTLQRVMSVSGVWEEHDAETIYACEVYPDAGNDLTSVAYVRKRIDGKVIFAQATTFRPANEITSICPCVYTREADFTLLNGNSDFPFQAYQAGLTPDGWVCTSRILSYHPTGQAAALEKSNKQCSETHFTIGFSKPVVSITGALKEEVLWNAFLSYDPVPGWIEHAEKVADAQFGDRSLLLEAGDYVQSPEITSVKKTEYVAELVYRTWERESSLDAVLRVTFGDTIRREALVETNGQWKNLRLALSGVSGPISVRVICEKGCVQLDRAALFPAEVQIEASCEDPHFLQPVSFMDSDSRVLRFVYDNCMRQIGTISPDGSLQELSMSTKGSCYIAGQHQHGHEASLTFAGGGSLACCGHWMGWERVWQTTGNGWRIEEGLLQTPDEGTLTWLPDQLCPNRAAVYLETASLPDGRKSMTCRFAANERIIWKRRVGWQWLKGNNTVRQAPLMDFGDNPGNRSLLVIGQGLALFYVDGFLLFSQADPAFMVSKVSWEIEGAIALSCLAVGLDPRMRAVYCDGGGRACQLHELKENYGIIQAWAYDSLDRPVALTRQAPCCGDEKGTAPMAFHQKFADIKEFLRNYRGDPVMPGNISVYYSGEEGRSDDGGYPYKGVRYAALREKRITEIGLPGKKRALRPVRGGALEPGGSTQKGYGAADAASGLPSELYAEKTLYPDKYQGIEYYDSLRRSVAAEQRDQNGKRSSFSTVQFIPQSLPGINAKTRLPLYFETGKTEYVREQRISAMKDLVGWKDCDGGSTEFIYDAFHKLRFSHTASEDGYFLYQKYDLHSRVTEEGILYGEWNEAVLQEKALIVTYPGSEDGAEVRRTYVYGNEGDNVGKLIRVVTRNPAPDVCRDSGTIMVTESWDYNKIGKISQACLSIQQNGQEFFSTSVSYFYNQLGDVVAIKYPEGAAMPEVCYSYNSLGEMTGIGTPQAPESIASYFWSASSQMKEARRGGLRELWNRDSAENIISHQVFDRAGEKVFFQDFYFSPGCLITKRTTMPAGGNGKDVFCESFAYDSMARMYEQEREGAVECYRYDVHGNIQMLESVEGTWNYEIEEDTNRLSRTLDPDGSERRFSYDNSGRPKRWGAAAISYDPGLRCVAALKHEGSLPLRMIYGANNRVVMRCQGEDVTFLFSGSGMVPLARWDNGRMNSFLWGPTGLEAISGERLRYPICDHMGTTWGVANGNGVMTARFDYKPFGKLICCAGEDAADWPFLFQGKEYLQEFGLYDFEARLYDPVLMRFLTPDPARQFSSAYLFAGNNPLFLVDPTGKSSFWTTFGMVAVSILSFVLGAAATVASGGLAAPVATAAVAAENITASGVVAGGFWLGAARITGSILLGALGGGLMGAGMSGMSYSFISKPGYEKNWEDFRMFYAAGMAGGTVSGAIGSIAGMAVASIPITQGIYVAVLAPAAIKLITSPAGSVLSKMVSNTILEQDLMMGTISSSLTGMVTGLFSGAYSGLMKCCDIRLPENAGQVQNDIQRIGLFVAEVKEKAIDFAKDHIPPVTGVAVLTYGAVCFGSAYISEQSGEYALTCPT